MERRQRHAVAALVRHGRELHRWPLTGPTRPDLSTVEELARLQLAARRLGCSIRLRDATPELIELVDLVGLREVGIDVSLRQVVGEAEHGEQGGVDEVVMPDDPVP